MEESFWSHFEDLRKRLIYSLVFFFLGSGAVYLVNDRIIRNLIGFVGKTYFFAPQEALFIRIKLSLMVGFVISLPFIVHQAYLFVAPALTKDEKRYSVPFLLSLLIFFYGGMVVSYYIFTPFILKMLLGFQMEGMEPLMSINRYINFLIWLLGGVGFAFEMPVLIFLLTKLGIITPSLLISNWRTAIIALLILGAVITPTLDIVTLLIVSIPLFFLYLVSIVGSFLARKR
ncbi:twin-arginine translocase subunit TatC [candidate division WOR-3 bacterium]|nr:twin-arginine translocase subunit TatC [candidate division WOR-3 bacterium]